MNNIFYDKTSDNKYLTCPPRMDDGRHFTDYRPNYYINNMIRMTNGITTSYDYRQYLIDHAEELMAINRQYSETKNCYGQKCDATPVPFHRECQVSISNVNCGVINKDGIGTRYTSKQT